jgi:hypothetical protein
MILQFTMAGLDLATQLASASERKGSPAPADAGAPGGRVKPGHGGRASE